MCCQIAAISDYKKLRGIRVYSDSELIIDTHNLI